MSEAAAVLPDVGTVSQFENLNLIYRRDMIWRCWRWLLIISRSVYKIVPGWRSSAPHRRRVCLCQWPAVQITQDTLSGAFLSLLRSKYGETSECMDGGGGSDFQTQGRSRVQSSVRTSNILISDLATWTPGHLDLRCWSSSLISGHLLSSPAIEAAWLSC